MGMLANGTHYIINKFSKSLEGDVVEIECDDAAFSRRPGK